MMELLQISFDIEKHFNRHATFKWSETWWTHCFYVSALYVLLVHWGQQKMKDRRKFGLRKALFLWSLTLGIFSAIGFYRLGGQFVAELQRTGWHETLCNVDFYDGQNHGLWCFLMAFSKLPELLDTLFIVLRKQKLIFLHWYHHVTVYCFAWYSYGTANGHTRLFMIMNYFVHMIMYSYYAIRAQGFVRIPRAVSIGITSLQLLQMLGGMGACVYSLLMLLYGIPCHAEYTNICIGLLMYISYTVLFGHFFYVNYLKKKETNS